MCNEPTHEVLVVEDEPLIRLDAVAMLQKAGFVVHEAEDGAQALSLLDAYPRVCVLFTDINMPGDMDGLELAREVHRRREQVQFVLTSGRIRPSPNEIPDDGVYLPKPYSHDEIVGIVRRMCT